VTTHTQNAKNASCLVDTNVLVYAFDPSSAGKTVIASQLLEHLATARIAAVTAQVATEFCNVVTRPRNGVALLDPLDALQRITHWLQACTYLDLTEVVSLTALRAAVAHGMNIYDAQMWAVAKVNGVPIIVTEDTQFAPEIEGVGYINPFAPSFAPAQLGL
jgi:predicted nucleic acid-binding protein